ncbi:hypothetical protein LOTGIDRAFT_152753 [Lottia gigantea]|uniref:Uncharacterized protein n=1 Tax=Lottia gigantea TaxID=225164 RepID=V4C7J2_LOTGI|nr:hypothetical protein LOTGIDRAFT_152753 [Lottia gigantea]ESO97664.1 hypothetical protein LOTGIDRAFT_152753 [Lottia gigantea]
MMMESSINSATILPPYEEEFEPVDNLHWSPETANNIYLFWIHQLQASKFIKYDVLQRYWKTLVDKTEKDSESPSDPEYTNIVFKKSQCDKHFNSYKCVKNKITTINNLVLKQDKNIVALEKKFLKKESYFFNLPFGNLSNKDASITDNIDKSKDYEFKKHGFKLNIRVFSPSNFLHPYDIFNSDYLPDFTFKGKLVIEINFPIQVKVDLIFFKQLSQFSSNKKFNARKVLQFINDTENVETKQFVINDENNKVDHLYEIKTNGQYIDRFRMLIIPDKENNYLSFCDFDMIWGTETPPSVSIIRNPEPQKKDISFYEFLRATDFEYVKLYFVNDGKFTSIDIHKSQQQKFFLIIDDAYVNISIFIRKPKVSVQLNKINDSKEQISLVIMD